MVESVDIESIQRIVESLLRALGARVEGITVSEKPRITVAVSSPDSEILIGPHGEVLQALNILARRLVEAKAPEAQPREMPNFLIDINGYHEAKLEELRQSARELATRAKTFKHEVELPPMSSYERLVVHEMFASDPEIETISTGEGKFRHIVLRCKGADEKGLVI